MKNLIAIVLVVLLNTALTGIAAADDVADVKATVLALYEALNNDDADGVSKLQDLQLNDFEAAGGLLTELPAGTTIEDIRSNQQAAIDTGRKLNYQLRHLNVKVYGNAAVATYYRTLSGTAADGTPLSGGPDRVSMVLNKQNGQWKQVHRHASPLLPAAP